MVQTAQAIMVGVLSPAEACQDIITWPLTLELDPMEPGLHPLAATLASALRRRLEFHPIELGLHTLAFSFQIVHSHLYTVASYSHDDGLDRGVVIGKIRGAMKNLVNWLLLSQSVHSSATIELTSEELLFQYAGEDVWVAQIPPEDKPTDLARKGSTEAIEIGVSWLPFLLKDPRLLYALQDYSASLKNPEICLFFLWRTVEWILWEFETREDVNNPAYSPAAKALGLKDQWFGEIANLAHSYTRHARLRDKPPVEQVEAARERVRMLILRYIGIKHKRGAAAPTELPADALTNWTQPKAV